MKDCKKLFQRDRGFCLALSGVVVLILAIGLFQCYDEVRRALEIIEQYKNYSFWNGIDLDAFVSDNYAGVMQIVFFVVLAAQIIKWDILEGKKGKEFQRLLPVKSRSHITYDLICGIVFVWVPMVLFVCGQSLITNAFHSDITLRWGSVKEEMLQSIVVFSLIYCMIVFARKIANNIPGALFTVFVIWYTPMAFGMVFEKCDWLMKFCTFDFGYGKHKTTAVLTALFLTVAVVLLSYVCDEKRDNAGTGVFSFRIVRYLVIAASFADLGLTFYECFPVYGHLLGFVRIALSVLLAGGIAAGLNYLMKPASYKA